MRDFAHLGPASALLGWLLFYALGISFLTSREAATSCTGSDVFWTSWWFLDPPLLAAVGAAASVRRHRKAFVAAAGLFVAWLPAASIWMILAIAAGATCHGG